MSAWFSAMFERESVRSLESLFATSCACDSCALRSESSALFAWRSDRACSSCPSALSTRDRSVDNSAFLRWISALNVATDSVSTELVGGRESDDAVVESPFAWWTPVVVVSAITPTTNTILSLRMPHSQHADGRSESAGRAGAEDKESCAQRAVKIFHTVQMTSQADRKSTRLNS